MSDIFREVDEALQQEKMAKIWKEYGSTILTALVILVLSTALTTAYRSWNANRNAEETARLITALGSKNPSEQLTEVMKDTRGGHEAIALMISANLMMEEDKTTEAAALYKDAAESGKTPKDMRDLARILYAQASGEDGLIILEPVLHNKKSPWIWHARIEAAVLAAHQNQDYDQALKYLEDFNSDIDIPFSLKQRGQALHHIYSLKTEELKSAPQQTGAAE